MIGSQQRPCPKPRHLDYVGRLPPSQRTTPGSRRYSPLATCFGMALQRGALAEENGETPSDGSSSLQHNLESCSDLFDPNTLDTGRQYTVIRRSGSGAFGEVYFADWHSPLSSGTMVPAMQHPYTRPAFFGKRIVAIKRCRFGIALTHGNTRLNELRALRSIPAHPNTIALYDVFRERNLLHIVFECMEGNLYQLIKSRKGLPMAPGLVASLAEQMFRGIAHVHSHGFFHRDMKPENVLVTTLGLGEYPIPGASATRQDVLVLAKVADFGLARSLDSQPPYSGYISTRWYRAPEVLLRMPSYSSPIDVWALAAITAEMVMLEPLFPGANELDQLTCIIRVLGTLGDVPQLPKQHTTLHVGGGPWKEAQALAQGLHLQLPEGPGVPFESLVTSSSYPMLVDLLYMMLRYDPHQRYTMRQCLQHPFFTVQMSHIKPLRCIMPGKESAGPVTPEMSNGQNLSDHGSPALGMESDEGLFKTTGDTSLPTSKGSPAAHLTETTTDSFKNQENEVTTSTNSSNLSDNIQSDPSRSHTVSLQRLHSRKTSPLLWGLLRPRSLNSNPEHQLEHKITGLSFGSNSSNDRSMNSNSLFQSHFLPTSGSIMSLGKPRKETTHSDTKQAERRKREEEKKVMQERSRAVMQKREALLQSNYGSIDKGTRFSGWSI